MLGITSSLQSWQGSACERRPSSVWEWSRPRFLLAMTRNLAALFLRRHPTAETRRQRTAKFIADSLTVAVANNPKADVPAEHCSAHPTMAPTSDSPASSHFETGSLTQRAPQQSEFIGSSSGVHFIKLVRAVCADTLVASHFSVSDNLRTEDFLGGDGDESDATDRYNSLRSQTTPSARATSSVSYDYLAILETNSSLPSHIEARTMAIQYFESWHPLLPFLYGPNFMRDLEDLYLGTQHPNEHRPALAQSRTGCHRFLLRCLFATLNPNQASVSPSDTLAIVGQLASHNDLLTIQAVLMAQLRCISTMALRVASSHSGLLSRLLLHAGLHRCPFRYEQLDNDLQDLRKRIFWSAYILDRYLSQALGLPPTIADSDVDVCAPGCPELHSSVHSATPDSAAETLRPCQSERYAGSAERDKSSLPHVVQRHGKDDVEPRRDGLPSPDRHEFLLTHLVTHAKLVGRVLEVFHKSIHVRSIETDEVLKIRAEANKWFNSLPRWPTEPGVSILDHLDRAVRPEQTKFVPFLHVLYQQLLIAIHRPYLSLPRTSAEYGNSIQLVVRAARQTIVLLSEIDELFWPGYLASAWMSGLVLIFACQTQAYGVDQGIRCVCVRRRQSDRSL